jgi:hypothetical protein
MDERCAHGVPLGKDNPNLPCSRCQRDEPLPADDDVTPVRLAAVTAARDDPPASSITTSVRV